MKRVAFTIGLIVMVAGPSFAGVTFHGATGQTLYVRFQTGATTFKGVSLGEGSGGGAGVYSASDSTIVSSVGTASAAAGFPNGYPFTIRSGTTSDTNNDPIIGTGSLPWSGSVELPAPSDVRDLLGTAWLPPATAGTPDVNTKTLSTNAISSGSVSSGAASVIRQEIDTNSTQLAAIRSDLDDAPSFAASMDLQGYTAARAAKLDGLAPSLLLSTTISGTPTSPTTFSLATGPADNNALEGALVIVTDGSGKKAVGVVKSYVGGSSHTVTLVVDPSVFTLASGNQVDFIADGNHASRR